MSKIDLNSEKTLYLVDGTSYAYRSFYAIKGLTNSKGLPTGAIFGFVNTLKKIIKDFSPIYMAVCFDVSKETFRQERYKDYKIKRPEIPDEFFAQLPWIKKILKALNVPVCEKQGFEADDVIATLARQYSEAGWRSVIFTSDKDMFQLVEDGKILLYDLNKNILFDKEEVLKKMKVYPENIPDFLGLAGDSSDDIPGVKGVGPKTAVSLINQFGSLENIYSDIDKVERDSVRNKLLESKEMANLSKELAVLIDNIDLKLKTKDLTKYIPDYQEVYAIARELEFKSLIKDFGNPEDKSAVSKDINEGDGSLLEKIKQRKQLVFFLFESNCYIFSEKNVYKVSIEFIKKILSDTGIEKISFDIKSQVKILNNSGGNLSPPYFDVMVAAFLLNSQLKNLSLESILWEHFSEATPNMDVARKVESIDRLYPVLKKQLQEEKMKDVFYEIEMPVLSVLNWMESVPVKMDIKSLRKTSSFLKECQKKVQADIFYDAGFKFNLNSPKQLSEVLFTNLGLKPIKKTKSGFSTSEEVLVRLKEQHEIAGKILEYRKLTKLISTYFNPLMDLACNNQGNVFPQFSQVGSSTGRLVSFSPNFQNIPVGDFKGKNIRECVISSFEKGVILSADYSQIELRVLAHISGDESFIESFKLDKDIHRATASRLFGKEEGDVSYSERELAKRINFGIIYGMSSYRLSRELSIGPKEASDFISEYFKRYPKVKEYIDTTMQYAVKRGFVETLFGRKRYLKNIDSKNRFLKEYALRQAVNAPIQGTAADIIKLAMKKVFYTFYDKEFSSKLIMQIHDELVFDLSHLEINIIKPLVKEIMEGIVVLSVPLKVNIHYGRTWLDATKS